MMDNNTTAVSNPEAILDNVNNNMRMAVLPVTILIGFENIVGLIGNTLILLVYSKRYERSNFRYFVLFMAFIDLISCLTCVPGELFSQLNWYKYEHAWICKVKSYFNVLGAWGSASILLLLAFDRHRKICRPLGWQIQPSLALKLCSTAVVLSSIVAAPITVLWGKQTYLYEKGDISVNVSVCEKSSEFTENTYYPFLYVTCVYTLPVSVMMVVIITLNILTARKLFCNRDRRLSEAFSVSTASNNSSLGSINTISDTVSTHGGNTVVNNNTATFIDDLTHGKDSCRPEARERFSAAQNIFTDDVTVHENAEFLPDKPVNDNDMHGKVETTRLSTNLINFDDIGRKTSAVTYITLNDIAVQKMSNHKPYPDTIQQNRPDSKGAKRSREHYKCRSISSNSSATRTARTMYNRSTGRRDGSELRVKRKTIIMLVLTTVFVITMSLYVILINIIADQNILQDISNSEKAVYFLFFRLYFVNCVINPFLYGFMDPRFRSGIKNMFCSK